MKNRAAVLFALMIGFSYQPSASVAMAVGNEGQVIESEEEDKEEIEETEGGTEQDNDKENEKSSEAEESKRGSVKTEDSFLNNLLGAFFSGTGEEDLSDDDNDKKQNAGDKKSAGQAAAGLKNLQIPQKLDVVIDPWEIDQKGQVYSEEYIISNTGENPGVLTLSGLTCRPREQSGAVVRTGKEGLHDGGDKSIYIEMLLGTGEKIVFSQENSQYQTKLEPGEELSVCFAGEVNENAFGEWKNDDVLVSMVYSWETEDMALKEQEEKLQDDIEDTIKEKKDESKEDAGEERKTVSDAEGSEEKAKAVLDSEGLEKKSEINTNDKKIENQTTEENLLEKDTLSSANEHTAQDASSNSAVGEIPELETFAADESGSTESNSADSADGMAGVKDSEIDSEPAGREKDEIRNIDLSESQKVDVVIDSWKTDEKGKIVSPQYLLRNTGNTAGIWELSELMCKPKEQSTVAVKTDKNELRGSGEKAVYMELELGNGEKTVLSQEKSEYKVELKPGEQLLVRFTGEMNGNLFETCEEGDIEVTAVCTWNLQ